jgi:PAS domain S-box-containing protein
MTARPSGHGARALSIEQKLPLLISALLLATLFVATWAAYAEVRRARVDGAHGRLRSTTRELADISQRAIAQRAALIEGVAADTAVRALLRRPGALALTPAGRAAVARLATPLDPTQRVELWDARGEARVGTEPLVAPHHAGQARRLLGAAAARGAVRSGPLYLDGDSVFNWTVAPVREDGVVLGYVARRGRIANPPEAERQIRTLIGEDVDVYVTDSSGGFWATLGGVPSPAPRDARELPDGLFAYGAGDGEMLGARAAIAGTPWLFALVTPRAAILAAPRAFARRMAVAAALIVLLGALAAWLLSRRVTGPLGALVGAAEAVAAGDYGRRVAFDRGDELGRLGQAFDRMAGRVGESHAALAEQAVSLRDSNEQLADQALELELSNQQLQEQATELEAQADELQATAAELEQRTEEAERAAAALRASEAQFRAMADSMPTLAWTARADGHIDWYNARWYEYTGTTPAAMAGWGWQAVHDPSVLPTVVERWTAALAAGQTFEMEFPLRGADGRFRTFLTRVAPVRDEAGRVTRWFGTNTDVEARREAAAERERLLLAEREARVRAEESERRFRETADAAPVLIWTAGVDTLCDWFNAPWVAYSGRPMAALVGNGWAEDVHPDDLDRCLRTYLTAFGAREPFSMEYRLRRHDGAYRWFLDNAVPRYASDGTFVGYIGTCVDVTDPRAALDAAEAANRAKSQFLSTMSHELRTPLNAIAGYAELLAMGVRGPVTDAQAQDLERLRRANRHLIGLIDDVLGFARLDAGQVAYRIEEVAVGALVADLEAFVGPQLAAKSIRYDGAGCDGRRRRAAAARRARRRREGAAGAAQPALERDQVHRARRAGGGGLRRRRRPRHDPRHRQRDRDPRRGARPHLRALRAGEREPHAHAGGHGARPLHQPRPRARHGRRPHGGERRGGGEPLRLHPPGGARATPRGRHGLTAPRRRHARRHARQGAGAARRSSSASASVVAAPDAVLSNTHQVGAAARRTRAASASSAAGA